MKMQVIAAALWLMGGVSAVAQEDVDLEKIDATFASLDYVSQHGVKR
ncbi:hypothetical protein HCH_02770 [Hahella chejuensis KCTC 2396]|uniref:Uncharacterized protein n=1 Tax=Hahella chejuensis (strain KCTC 2396) TaxID=349521 RepID=Q2SIH1_HAHCH|nr:hypothetical protein [Hahella chejuensis]ABC29553.1 hypothetical protein HCH_02770 [Hahella chejuensis KCTC 2396]